MPFDWVSTAFAAKTLPLPCVSTAVFAETIPSPLALLQFREFPMRKKCGYLARRAHDKIT